MYAVAARTICRRLLAQVADCALLRADASTGSSTPIRMAMIPITTRRSTSVKAPLSLCAVLRGEGGGEGVAHVVQVHEAADHLWMILKPVEVNCVPAGDGGVEGVDCVLGHVGEHRLGAGEAGGVGRVDHAERSDRIRRR